jgi:hypothetical protein
MAKQIADNLVAALAREEDRMTYPWETWANGKWWQLEGGVDFYKKPSYFRTLARGWGNKHGYVTETRVTQDGKDVLLRFTPE